MLEKVLFAGGGTGGHVFMAVSLRDALRQARPEGTKCLFVGTRAGIENRILPPIDFPLATIQIGGLKNVGLRRQLATSAQLPFSLWQSARIIRQFDPDVIVGLGGYSSGPVLLAGAMTRRPSILIEPNVTPGFTNRCLGPLVKGAAVAFEETSRHFPGKAVVTGIPIRAAFFGIAPKSEFRTPIRLLVFGGSRGSRPINELVCDSLRFLDPRLFEIHHQTGEQDCSHVAELYSKAGVTGKVVAFMDDMPSQFAWADLVIGRSGASTVAEVTAAGRPSILIPFPQAADDHQRKNAEALERHGAAICIDQLRVSGEQLAGILTQLARSPERLVAMASASGDLAQPDSANRIVQIMERVARRQ